jgi:hypothetical protein
MERNFNNEFERFLKENADQYRMYPSSKVWSGIYTTLHTRRKWFGLGIALLLLTGTLITLLITHSSKQTAIIANKPVLQSQDHISASSKTTTPDKRIGLNAFENETKDLVAVKDKNHLAETYNSSIDDLVAAEEITIPEINQTDLRQVVDNSVIDNEITNQYTPNDFVRAFDYPKSLNPYITANAATIENAVNDLIHPSLGHRSRFSVQLNFTPTISYRKLSENKSFLLSSVASNVPSSYVPLYDINSAVTHKPDLGFEFGLTAKYALATNFKVKAGVQFNINRYDIKAFNSPYEVARIALRGNGNRGVDSANIFTNHRNFNGYKSDWLQNFYFEISIPVGLEVNILGDDKVQFGVAGTIQPTYVLGDRAYLLSTDYKNYAQVPWLIRRWNVSTGLETFVSYSTRKLKWQVGPEVRYQLLSSFIDKYPVKENLFDFGLKIGVSRNK